MNFEDILLEAGDYGRYQKHLVWYFLIPASTILPWLTFNIFFMISVPDHWCNVPVLAHSNLSISEQRSLIAPPGEECRRYDINFTEYLNNKSYMIPNNTKTRPCDHGWQYDHTFYDSTAATTWDLVCDNAHYNTLILTLFYVGSIVGTPIYGFLADKIGRKITFFIIVVVTAVTSFSSSLITNFTAFVVLKTINGSLWPSVFQLPFISTLEIVAPEMRTRINGIVNAFWSIGLCFLPLIAYLSRSWSTLGLVTSCTLILFLFQWNFMPESPRWLVLKERYDEAIKIILNVAKKNRNVQDENEMTIKLRCLFEQFKKESIRDAAESSALDLIKYPQLRKKFIILTFCWIANVLAYYGLQINIANLSGNQFLNFFLLSLVEIPGYFCFWLALERFGRRWVSATGFLVTGVVCFLPIIDLPYLDVISSMIGKFIAAGTFMATYQQSSELYPTVIRSQGVGISFAIASIFNPILPYIVYLGIYGRAIPFVIFGLSCLLAGILVTFLPETLNENLPQSVMESEMFARDRKYFTYYRRKQSLSRERAASLSSKISLDERDSGYLPSKTTENGTAIAGSLKTIYGSVINSIRNRHEQLTGSKRINSTQSENKNYGTLPVRDKSFSNAMEISNNYAIELETKTVIPNDGKIEIACEKDAPNYSFASKCLESDDKDNPTEKNDLVQKHYSEESSLHFRNRSNGGVNPVELFHHQKL